MTARTLPPDRNTSAPKEQRLALLRSPMTIRLREMGKFALRSRVSNRINRHAGTSITVDGVALRLSLTRSQFDWFWSWATGEANLPRQRVERIDVQSEQ